MAEYYPLLAKAVGSLPNSTPDSRKVVYERARKALIGQLRTLHPPVPDEDIERESVALDGAIARLETELAAVATPVDVPLASVEPVPPREAPKPETTPARFPASGGAMGPLASKPFPQLRTKVPSAKPASPPAPIQDAVPSETPRDGDVAVPVPAATAAAAALDAPAAPLAMPPAGVPDGERKLKSRSEQKQRPIAPQPPEPKRPKRPLWIIPAGIAAVVLIVAFAAFKLRDRPEAFHAKTAEQQPADAGKSVERVGGQPATDDSKAQKTADQTPAAAGQTASQNAAPANPPAPVAGRAAMLVEAPEEANKVKTYLGTVVWRLDNVSDGQNQAVGLAVRADIDLPDDKLKASVVFQKNSDASLPASHTLKIRFIVQPGSPSGNVKDINVPQMRREDSANGDPLDGVTVPIVENSFLIGLTPGNSENANLDLLKGREWIDIPIRLSNGKIAKLTFEKTEAGQRDIQEAITAWTKP